MFICEKDEYGWTTYITWDDPRISAAMVALANKYNRNPKFSAGPYSGEVIVVREQIQAYYE